MEKNLTVGDDEKKVVKEWFDGILSFFSSSPLYDSITTIIKLNK